jgi:molybdopterin converting factor small subunit
MKIRLAITGRSYHTAEQLPDQITLPDASSVDDAISHLSERLPNGVELPASCLVAVSGEHLGTLGSHQSRQLVDGDELTLIAPVAGG